MTNEQLDELERLEKAATPGPWESTNGRNGYNLDIQGNRAPSEYEGDPDSVTWLATVLGNPTSLNVTRANADLIILMRNALPDMIAEVRRLREYEQSHQWMDEADKYMAEADAKPFTKEQIDKSMVLIGDIAARKTIASLKHRIAELEAVVAKTADGKPPQNEDWMRDIVAADEVQGGGWIVTLICGHRMATRKKEIRYFCYRCREAAEQAAKGGGK